MAERLTSFSDEHLASELRTRGWRCYPKARVKVMSYSRIIPREQWDMLRAERPYVESVKRQATQGLAHTLHAERLILFNEYDARWDYYERGHVIEASIGVITPKEKCDARIEVPVAGAGPAGGTDSPA